MVSETAKKSVPRWFESFITTPIVDFSVTIIPLMLFVNGTVAVAALSRRRVGHPEQRAITAAALYGEPTRLPLHAHDLVATIHVDHLAGYGRGTVARQEQARGAQFIRQYVALQR